MHKIEESDGIHPIIFNNYLKWIVSQHKMNNECVVFDSQFCSDILDNSIKIEFDIERGKSILLPFYCENIWMLYFFDWSSERMFILDPLKNTMKKNGNFYFFFEINH